MISSRSDTTPRRSQALEAQRKREYPISVIVIMIVQILNEH